MSEKKLTARKEKALETRARILETAIELFAKRGYDEVTIDDIVDAVGLSKGAFYSHFKSKDQIFLEEFIRIDRNYVEVFEELSEVPDTLEKLRRFWTSSLEYVDSLGVSAVKVVFHAEIGPSRDEPDIASRERPVFKISEQLLSEARAAGFLRDDMTPGLMRDLVVSCWRGAIYDWCLADGGFDLTDRGTKLLDLLLNGLAKH